VSNPFSKARKVISAKERQRRANDMYAFLCSQPIATNSPMIDYNKLVEELSLFEGMLNKLKAFVRFLSKLNPTEYLRWFHKAYAGFTLPISETTVTTGKEVSSSSSAPSFEHAPQAKTLPQKKTAKRKKTAIPTI
jgi:hypothetical protein